jgi:predicted alpha/beta superfamily hydrolase
VRTGRIERLHAVASRHVDARPIDVWLPQDYAPDKRYAVLYMQDGQNLFDASQTWNKSAWNVHEALAKLMQQGRSTGHHRGGHSQQWKIPLQRVLPRKIPGFGTPSRS